jgi:hypothetical protein
MVARPCILQNAASGAHTSSFALDKFSSWMSLIFQRVHHLRLVPVYVILEGRHMPAIILYFAPHAPPATAATLIRVGVVGKFPKRVLRLRHHAIVVVFVLDGAGSIN